MKKFLILIAAIALFSTLFCVCVFALFGQSGNLTWEFDPETLELFITGTGPMNYYYDGYNIYGTNDSKATRAIIIDYGATSVARWAFRGFENLTTVRLANTITYIGRDAFRECSLLHNVMIPDSVTYIDTYAFYNCSSLEYVFIPNSVTTVGYNAFANCPNLKIIIEEGSPIKSQLENEYDNCEIGFLDDSSKLAYKVNPEDKTATVLGYQGSAKKIDIPDSINGYKVTGIDQYVFKYDHSITSINIGDNVTGIITKEMFIGCSSLKSVTIGDSVTSIGKWAFQYCDSLTSVTIGDSVTSIGDSAFEDCYSLTSVTIGDSVTSIGDYAFSWCSSLTSVTIGDSVTRIGKSAFYSCYSLTSVTIPDSVTSIGIWAFSSCGSLTSVTIPDSVTSIDSYAFNGCSSLKTLYLYKNSCADKYFKSSEYTKIYLDNVSYTITYNANGGSGAPSSQTKEKDASIYLSSTVPTRSGYTFSGWATSSGGSAVYQPGDKYTQNASITLYAVWTKNATYTITYNANGGSGAPSSQTKEKDTSIYLSSTVPTRSGYTFSGWATSSGGSAVYQPGAKYTANANITLYAVWTKNVVTYTITYNANGGSGAPAEQIKTQGETLYLSNQIPSRSGYNFKGWSTSKTGSVAYKPGAMYTANASITLYAVWEESQEEDLGYNEMAVSSHFANKGDTVKVTFTFGDISGLASLQFSVSYDSSVLTPISITYPSGTKLTCNIEDTAFDPSEGVFKVMLMPFFEKALESFVVDFKVSSSAPSGTYYITPKDFEVYDNNFMSVDFETNIGAIEVIDPNNNTIKGDINGDGKLNYSDVSKLYAVFRQKTTISSAVDTDINGDGNFNYSDVSKLYAIFRGKATFN